MINYISVVEPLKGTKARPAKSCLDILVSSHSKGTRVYWLDPPNTGIPIQGFCDMDTDGGNRSFGRSAIRQFTIISLVNVLRDDKLHCK